MDNFLCLLHSCEADGGGAEIQRHLSSLVTEVKASEASKICSSTASMVRYLRSQGVNYTQILERLGLSSESAEALIRVEQLYPTHIHRIRDFVEGLCDQFQIGLLTRGDEVLNVGVLADTMPKSIKTVRFPHNGQFLFCLAGKVHRNELAYLDHLEWWGTAERVELNL